MRWVVEHDGAIWVPTPVLVESTTGDGGRDAEVNRVLGVLERAASELQAGCSKRRTPSTVDEAKAVLEPPSLRPCRLHQERSMTTIVVK